MKKQQYNSLKKGKNESTPAKPSKKISLLGVIVCLALLYGLYLQGAYERKTIAKELKGKISSLEERLARATAMREDLVLQIESQSDPLWVEMLMKEHLGMVSKNQTKVYFESN